MVLLKYINIYLNILIYLFYTFVVDTVAPSIHLNASRGAMLNLAS